MVAHGATFALSTVMKTLEIIVIQQEKIQEQQINHLT